MKNIAGEDYDAIANNLNKSQTSPDQYVEDEELPTKTKRRIKQMLEEDE